MGQIDMILKDYLSDRRRFADVFNGSVFAGQQILRAEELEPMPTSAVQKSQDGYMERISDYVMRQKYTGNLFYIWILENQDKIDYSMIIRVMLKEAMEYDKQLRELKKKNAEGWERAKENGQKPDISSSEFLCKVKKTDRLHPVTTLVIYWGRGKWDGARSLHEMLDFGSDEDRAGDVIRRITADYPLQILDLSDENDYDAYQTEMRAVFACYARRDDKDSFYTYVSNDESFRHMDRETIEVIGRLTNAQELLNIIDKTEEGEECDVCKAIKDLIEDGRIAGRAEGRAEGRKEGIHFVKDVANRLGAGESEETLLAEVAEEERETCKAITDLIEDGRTAGRKAGREEGIHLLKDVVFRLRAGESEATLLSKGVEEGVIADAKAIMLV